MLRDLTERAVAAVALAVLSPVLVVVALVVRVTSPGPALFRQVRIGKDGAPFQIYKFRSMVQDADRVAANVSPQGDPRVTPVGRVLRASYVDELPQLLNVVRGDMGLVGPRPETPEFVALYTPSERAVLSVRPGIAGPSTLAFMDEAEQLSAVEDPAQHYRDVMVHERVRMDLEYLDKRSFLHDLRLLLRQVVAVMRH